MLGQDPRLFPPEWNILHRTLWCQSYSPWTRRSCDPRRAEVLSVKKPIYWASATCKTKVWKVPVMKMRCSGSSGRRTHPLALSPGPRPARVPATNTTLRRWPHPRGAPAGAAAAPASAGRLRWRRGRLLLVGGGAGALPPRLRAPPLAALGIWPPPVPREPRRRPLGPSAWRGGASHSRLRPQTPSPGQPSAISALLPSALRKGLFASNPGFGPPLGLSVTQSFSPFLQPLNRSPRPTLALPSTCTPTLQTVLAAVPQIVFPKS